MTAARTAVYTVLFLAGLATGVSAQKVKVGYDKSVDFSKYKTYSWAERTMPTNYPLLYTAVVASIDSELLSRGLQRVDKDGDLILASGGGIAFGTNAGTATPILPSYSQPPIAPDSTMWTGDMFVVNRTSIYVPAGTLQVQFVDRIENRIVWNGMVFQKLDVEKKSKSLDLVNKAIVKLLQMFPPKPLAR
jgi:Domain of unknown function (DUF4136)